MSDQATSAVPLKLLPPKQETSGRIDMTTCGGGGPIMNKVLLQLIKGILSAHGRIPGLVTRCLAILQRSRSN